MIGGKRKTIGIFINKTDDYFDSTVFRVIQEHAARLDLDVYFFLTVGYHGSKNYYDTQESNMFRFAPIEKLDGIIAVPDSYEMADFRSAFLSELSRRATCPIVNIRYSKGPHGCVFTDENIAIRPLIRHLIEDHQLEKIAFLAGYKGHADSDQRLQCFIEEMEAHHLELSEKSIFYGNMWYNGTDLAYDYLFGDPGNRPQAVVCANDYMAHGLIQELDRHGLKVPEDVVVTGFDNIESAAFTTMLTTIGQDYGSMVIGALNRLYKIIAGEVADPAEPYFLGLPGTLVLGESCGCVRPGAESYKQISITNGLQLHHIRQQEISQTYLSVELNSCDTLRDMHDVLVQKSEDIPAQRDFYLCLFENENGNPGEAFSEEISEKVNLVIGIKDRQDVGMPMIRFNRSDLLPPIAERPDEPQAFFIMLLHQGNSTFGYTALQYAKDESPSIFYHHRNVIIANALRNMHSRMTLRKLYEDRRLSSITDPMTHLFNRRGLEEQVEPYWSRYCETNVNVCLVYLDLNNLKKINDSHGHAAGDRALIDFASMLLDCAPSDASCARMGGDEFLCFLPDAGYQSGRLLVDRLQNAMAQHENVAEGLPFSCSFGIYSARLREGNTFESCIVASDELMYKNKTANKQGRL